MRIVGALASAPQPLPHNRARGEKKNDNISLREHNNERRAVCTRPPVTSSPTACGPYYNDHFVLPPERPAGRGRRFACRMPTQPSRGARRIRATTRAVGHGSEESRRPAARKANYLLPCGVGARGFAAPRSARCRRETARACGSPGRLLPGRPERRAAARASRRPLPRLR